jgi:leader peptidase (prepilin peptidase)/N-methyltransferase
VVSELQLLTGSMGLVLAIILGLIWGSFANVCIYRWPPSEKYPHGRSVVTPGSSCGACGAPVRWYDNVPVLSYMWLRGRCRACKTAFSPRYLLVEALAGALFGVAWWFTFGTGGMLLSLQMRAVLFVTDAAFIWTMIVIAFIDLDTQLILNKVTIPAIPIFYALSLATAPWWAGLVGAAVGYGVPWLIGELYLRVRKREGLGLGDSTMLAVVGALLGWKGVVVSLFGGSLLGSVIGIVVLARSKKAIMQTELPFGPFLAAAAVFYLFAEPWLVLQFRPLL